MVFITYLNALDLFFVGFISGVEEVITSFISEISHVFFQFTYPVYILYDIFVSLLAFLFNWPFKSFGPPDGRISLLFAIFSFSNLSMLKLPK